MRLRFSRLLGLVASGFLSTVLLSAQEAPSTDAGPITRVPRLDGRLVKIGGVSHGQRARTAPKAWGTDTVSVYRQSAYEYFPSISTQAYDDDANATTAFHRYTVGPGPNFALVGPHPHLPGGVRLTALELDFCDTNPVDEVVLDLWACDYLGLGCGAGPIAVLVSGTSAGCGFVSMDLTPLNYTINNFGSELVPIVFTEAGDETTSLAGVIFGYRLQLSEAPVFATFPDVPTTDFAFQYVEALFDSGITGGCGAGLYCPDSPVTRRQMAIFIAKALGLSWSGY